MNIRARIVISALALLWALPLYSQNAPQEKTNLVRNGLFNDASGSLTFWNTRDGGMGTFNVIKSAEEGTSNVLDIHVKDTSPRPWTMELQQSFESKIEKATVVYISFDYKISPGYSFNFYWQEERSPWPKLLSLHIDSPTDVWKRVQMAVPMHESYEPSGTALSFHLAEKVGTIQLRNISAIVLPPGTNPDILNTNVNPVLGGDFYDKDWRSLAQERLNTTRVLKCKINVTHKDGSPISEAKVDIRQKSRHFDFGVETSFPLFNTEAMAVNDNVSMLRRYTPFKEQLAAYKKYVLDRSRFSFITFTDGFVWRENENWGKKFDKDIIKEVLDNGFYLRGHALYIPAYMFAPAKCRTMDRAKMEKEVSEHIKGLALRHKGNIKQWNVVHGAIDYSEIYNLIGMESLIKAYKIASESVPEAQLFYSDVQGLSAISDVAINDTVELVEWLLQNGVKLSGIVLGANMRRLDVGPQRMEKRLDIVAQRLNIPIHIANFAVSSDSEEFQSATISDYMLLFYSHPHVQSVEFAEAWAPALLNPKMALYKDDMSPRPAALLIDKLLKKSWWTEIYKNTGKDGHIEAELFDGIHSIFVTVKGKTTTYTLDTADFRKDGPQNRPFSGGYATVTKKGVTLNLVLP